MSQQTNINFELLKDAEPTKVVGLGWVYYAALKGEYYTEELKRALKGQKLLGGEVILGVQALDTLKQDNSFIGLVVANPLRFVDLTAEGEV
jgi:hypothetical protein